MQKVQRPERKLVHSSEWKWGVPYQVKLKVVIWSDLYGDIQQHVMMRDKLNELI
jgi:hypothetical protein